MIISLTVTMVLAFFTSCSHQGHKLASQNFKSANPVLNDDYFVRVIANHPIKMVVPASAGSPESILQLSQLKGLQIHQPEGVIDRVIAFHGNSDDKRFNFFKQAVLDSKSPSSLIWALRGGYGSARLIPSLEKIPLSEIPTHYQHRHHPAFIGYSDMTALHLFLSQKWHWQTIHGPMLAELNSTTKNQQNFRQIAQILAPHHTLHILSNLVPMNEAAMNLSTKIQGKLTGGNLAIIQTSIGTSWQMQAAGKIVFLEDVNVSGYQVDRMLNHLVQSQVLQQVKAIIFGTFAKSSDDLIPLALQRFAEDNPIPIFKSELIGHGDQNFPLIYNADSEIRKFEGNNTYDLLMHYENESESETGE